MGKRIYNENKLDDKIKKLTDEMALKFVDEDSDQVWNNFSNQMMDLIYKDNEEYIKSGQLDRDFNKMNKPKSWFRKFLRKLNII